MDSKISFLSKNLPLLLILALGAALRLFWLDKSPPSLSWDEASLGYNAYSLMQTGKDEYGERLPIVLRSFDDYKPALYSYLTIPFISAFGLNEIAVRLPSVLAGIATILLIFFLTDHFFARRAALLAAAAVAFEPWSVHFSRVAFEANLGNTLLLAGILFGLKANNSPKLLLLSFLAIMLSTYAYHASRILFLPILLALIFANWPKIKENRKIKLQLALLVTILVIPLFLLTRSGQGTARLQTTTILKFWKGGEIPLTSLADNPLYSLGFDFAGRYLSYFSPANLFVRGTPEPNQRIPGFAPFYGIEFFFWLSGFLFLARNKFKPRFLTFLIALAPIPSAITWNWFNLSRVLLLFAIYAVLVGVGLNLFIEYVTKKGRLASLILLGALLSFFVTQVAQLTTTIAFFIPLKEKGTWQAGFRETVGFVQTIKDNYDQVVFETGHAQPHIFTLFYSRYSPEKYQQEPRGKIDFDKYRFRKIDWPRDKFLRNTLFVAPQSLRLEEIEETQNARHLTDILDRHGEFVARIVELK